MGTAGKTLEGAEAIFIALLTIGLIGLLFLIIYGNLSGNLGFASSSNTTLNESNSYDLDSINTVILRGLEGYQSFTVSEVWNITNETGTAGTQVLVGSGNYTVDSSAGTVTRATGATSNYTDINISYTTTFKGVSELNTDRVISNLTGGATQFFTFADVWFILTAVTVLIGIVLGVIALVRRVSNPTGSKSDSGRASFSS